MPSAIVCATPAADAPLWSVEPWVDTPAAEVRALLGHECTRWSVDLGWDLGRDWAAVDPARRSGLLPGWVVRDVTRRVRGWAFGVDGADVRQVGALVAADTSAAQVLFETVCATAARVEAFVRANEVVTPARWRAHGFNVQPYEYRVASIRPDRRPEELATRARVWEPHAVGQVAAFLQRAYETDRTLRPFARAGRLAEWEDYVRALTERPGCGVFSPESSVMLVDNNDQLEAVALVTSVGATTAHLAQIAVAPHARGQGLAARVLETAARRAQQTLGVSRLSLLVSTANPAATRLYERAGFRSAGEFLAAVRT